MKNRAILIALTVICFVHSHAIAQDEVFTQWESMPVHFNPALTGNFDGVSRFRAKYRNQWQSLLQNNSYNTTAASIDYNFNDRSQRRVSAGFYTIFDRAGRVSFSTQTFNFTTSVIQNIGDPDNAHHLFALGLKAGVANRSLDLNDAIWPGGIPPGGINAKVNFADVSAGLNWQYFTNTHFSFQFGTALHHVNRPSVSFLETIHEDIHLRFHLHGNVEVPLTDKISLLPAFLFLKQGPVEQLLFGFSGKWYLKSRDTDCVQLGFFAKTTNNLIRREITIYVLSATVELNSILFGFSYDRFHRVESNVFEFSVGYMLGRQMTINEK